MPDYDRGPWWWRARIRLANLLGGWACRLEPDDRTSVSWLSDDGKVYHFAIARRPR